MLILELFVEFSVRPSPDYVKYLELTLLYDVKLNWTKKKSTKDKQIKENQIAVAA